MSDGAITYEMIEEAMTKLLETPIQPIRQVLRGDVLNWLHKTNEFDETLVYITDGRFKPISVVEDLET